MCEAKSSEYKQVTQQVTHFYLNIFTYIMIKEAKCVTYASCCDNKTHSMLVKLFYFLKD